MKSDSLSPVINAKNRFDLKRTGFEMIPEEDEDKNKTGYDTAKKFYEKDGIFNSDSLVKRSISFANAINDSNKNTEGGFNSFNNSDLKRSFKKIKLEIVDKDKAIKSFRHPYENNDKLNKNLHASLKNAVGLNENNLNSFTFHSKHNNEAKDKEATIVLKQARQVSKERSLESPSTSDYTYVNESINKPRPRERDSTLNTINNTINNILKDDSTIDVRYKETFSPNPIKSGNETGKTIFDFSNRESQITPKNVNNKSNLSNLSSNKTTPEKKEKDAITTNKFTKINKSSDPVKIVNSERSKSGGVASKMSSVLNGNKPPDKLPLINSSRRKLNIDSDLTNIFDAANNFKEDPVIKQKLDDILQNIVDIKNVLNQKTKTRVKIASAPSNKDTTTNALNSTLDKNPTPSSVFGRRKYTAGGNNTNSNVNLTNNGINNNMTNTNTVNHIINSTNAMNINNIKNNLNIKKDKVPIKLVKK